MEKLFEGCSIILIKDDTIAMQLRDKKKGIFYPGYWCIPGGRIEEGEDAKKAIIRETKEEMDYHLTNPFIFYVETYKTRNGMTVRRYIFIEAYDNNQQIECFEGQKIEFKSLSEIQKLKIFPKQKPIIIKALKIYKDLIGNGRI